MATYYNHTLTPNARLRDCITSAAVTPAQTGWFAGHVALRSYHVGMANVCLADGSVRSASDNVDIGVWRGVGSCQGGEVIGEF